MNWEYLKARISIDPDTDCWNWTRSKTTAGYGDFGGKWCEGHHYAHRVSYELTNGSIPKGLLIRHRCDNPSCINPAHLEIGTDQDNNDDMRSKNRDSFGERHSIKLTQVQVQSIRKDKRTHKLISAEYGVSQSYISMLKNNKRWKRYE